jgi:uncharacterized protein YidB (DUF937 family)
MSLLESILGGSTGNGENRTQANPLIGIIAAVLAQSGGLQGLMNKFSQAGLGNVFNSWVSTGPNQAVSSDQVSQLFAPEQIQALAAKLGIDPRQVSDLMAQHLPKIVDQLTPTGKIDSNVDTEEGLSSLIPSLLKQFSGGMAQR